MTVVKRCSMLQAYTNFHSRLLNWHPWCKHWFLFTLGFRKICRDIDIFRYPVIVQKIREYPVIIVILLNVEKSDILVLFCLFLL